MFRCTGIWVEWRIVGPFRSPVYDDTPHAENISMLCSVVLHNSLKAIELIVVLTTVAEKELLLVLLCQWFDLCVENPFHVVQDDLPSRRSIRGILNDRSTSGKRCAILPFNVVVESVTYVY
jgi:hypothetical protein